MIVAVIRTTILYIFVIIAIRTMGKRQIGDMQPSELVITLLISEIAAIPIQDLTQPMSTGIIAIFTLIVIEIFLSFASMKILSLRKVFYGDPAIVIKDGKLDQKMLKNLRLTIPDLMEILHGQNVFDIKTVLYAILETNGNLSVLLKKEYQNTINLSSDIDKKEETLPCLIISDGHLIEESLKIIDVKLNDLLKILSKEKIQINDIFLMTCDKNKNYYYILKDKQ